MKSSILCVTFHQFHIQAKRDIWPVSHLLFMVLPVPSIEYKLLSRIRSDFVSREKIGKENKVSSVTLFDFIVPLWILSTGGVFLFIDCCGVQFSWMEEGWHGSNSCEYNLSSSSVVCNVVVFLSIRKWNKSIEAWQRKSCKFSDLLIMLIRMGQRPSLHKSKHSAKAKSYSSISVCFHVFCNLMFKYLFLFIIFSLVGWNNFLFHYVLEQVKWHIWEHEINALSWWISQVLPYIQLDIVWIFYLRSKLAVGYQWRCHCSWFWGKRNWITASSSRWCPAGLKELLC